MGSATVLPFYFWDYHLQSQGRSAEAKGMPWMPMHDMDVYWAVPIIMATGVAALIWSWISVMLGLLDSGKPIGWLPLTRAQIDRFHRQVSLLVLALVVVHAVMTVYDAMGDTWLSVFVPGKQVWAPWGYSVGIVALYLSVLLGPTYYLRRWIGPSTWRYLHRFSLLVYILSLWHTLLVGADVSENGWVRPTLWLAQLPVLALLAYRVARPLRRSRTEVGAPTDAQAPIRWATVACVVAVAVVVVAIVTTGNAGIIAHSNN